MPVTAKHLNRLESIQETIARCEYLSEGLCMHCNDKADLISIACAWAFDEGAKAATFEDVARECIQHAVSEKPEITAPAGNRLQNIVCILERYIKP